MIDVDRFFIAVALQRKIVDAAKLRSVLKTKTNHDDEPLAELLARGGLIARKELDAFQRMVSRVIDNDPDHAGESLRQMTDAAVQSTLATLDDPLLRAFLIAKGQGAGRLVESRSALTLLSPCGKGGIGRIWLAQDNLLDRQIALKELRPDRAPNAVLRQRFVREARITGHLQHPGIVPVYRLEGRVDSTDVFYTMRLLKGRTLEELVNQYHQNRSGYPGDRGDTLALNQLITAFESTCQAISYAHSQGIVHRDLKPANIMLGDFGEAVVLDWGLAKRLHNEADAEANFEDSGVVLLSLSPEDSDMTQAGQILGTPHYMAPEQAAGRNAEIGVACDIFALGGILFNILTGSVPHVWGESASSKEFLQQIIESDPPRVCDLAPWAPPQLEAICAKAMARLPHRRYASVADLIADVRCWSAGEPVSVYPEGWPSRAARWMARNKGAVAVAGGVLLTILFIVAVMLGYGWANAISVIAVKKEELRDLSENMSLNVGYMLRLRAEGVRFLGRSPEIEGIVTAHQENSAVRERAMRNRAVRSLGDIVNTRNTRHIFAVLDARDRQEIFRVSGPNNEPNAASIMTVEPTPTMPQETVDDILLNVARLAPKMVYSDPVQPVVRDGLLVDGEYPNCRNCCRIVDAKGEMIGALVNECPLVPDFGQSSFDRRQDIFMMSTFVANEDGHIVYYSLAKDFELPKPVRPKDLLTDIFPELTPLFDPGQKDQQWLSIDQSLPTDQVVFASKVVFERWQPERSFIQVSSISRRQVLREVEGQMTYVLIATLISVVVGVLIAWLLARRLSRYWTPGLDSQFIQ